MSGTPLPNNPNVTSNVGNAPPTRPLNQPPTQPPTQPSPQEVVPDVGQQFAAEARAAAGIPTESKTFKISWPAEMGASWMTTTNLEQIIKNCCPGAKFKVTE